MVKVRVTEISSRDVDVYFLTDEEKALGYVKDLYEKDEIVLDYNDFSDVEFSIVK